MSTLKKFGCLLFTGTVCLLFAISFLPACGEENNEPAAVSGEANNPTDLPLE